jgi:Flp pilus assembly pilin Flp
MTGFGKSRPYSGTTCEKRDRIAVKEFLSDQRGLNTVELVVIIAIVIGLALLFRGRITAFVTVLLDGLFSDETAKTLVDGVQVGK